MKPLNPELDSQISALAKLCCSALDRESRGAADSTPLIKALVRGGYARLSDCNLQTRIEKIVLDECLDVGIHRRGELAGITGQMQSKFDELVRWETQKPSKADEAKAANISSANDA